MGDSKISLTKFDSSDSKKESVDASHLAGELMTCKENLDPFRAQVSNVAELCGFPSGNDLLIQFNEKPHYPRCEKETDPKVLRCEAPVHKKYGNVDVTVDSSGDVIEFKSRGNTYTKRSDGKWVEHPDNPAYSDSVLDNVTIDKEGNFTYDYNDDERGVHVHHEWNADGSFSFTDSFGKSVYNEHVQLVEAPSGEGRIRKYHYTDGQLDQIDGNLGHWDRVVTDGHVSWVNQDKGYIWNGDFKIYAGSDLQFKSDEGTTWTFTRWGTDVSEKEV